MMLWKWCTQYASKFGKVSSGHRTGKGQLSFQSQREAMPKNVQTTTQINKLINFKKLIKKIVKGKLRINLKKILIKKKINKKEIIAKMYCYQIRCKWEM